MPIQLPANQVIVTTKGGATLATIDAEVLQQLTCDFRSQVITTAFMLGTPASNAFQPSPIGGGVPASISFNLAAGTWSNDQQAGQLSPADIANISAIMKSLRNAIEQASNSIGVVPGAVVSWS